MCVYIYIYNSNNNDNNVYIYIYIYIVIIIIIHMYVCICIYKQLYTYCLSIDIITIITHSFGETQLRVGPPPRKTGEFASTIVDLPQVTDGAS